MTESSPDTASTLSSAVASPISRRTVLAGTAFAVPAIMLTASSPAFAASGLALAFSNPSYTGQACSTISGVKVRASENNAPKAGAAITVSLSNGFTFVTGGTSSTVTTGADGSVDLPGIKVPATGGSGIASATSSGASSVSVSLIRAEDGTARYLQNGQNTDAIGVPAGSAPVASSYFLAPDGRLIDGSNGDVNDTNVDITGQLTTGPTGDWRLPYRLQTGSAKYLANGTPTNAIGVPTGSTPVASAYFLTADGRLVDGSNGDVNATDVTATGQLAIGATGNWRLPYRTNDGTAKYLANGTPTTAIGVSSGSIPVSSAYFLTSDGRLIDGSNGDVNDTDVAIAGQASMGATGNWRLPYRTNDGTAKYLANGTPTTAIGVPAGSTPVAAAYFLSSDGRLIDGSNGEVNATNVNITGQYSGTENSWRLPFQPRADAAKYLQTGTSTNAIGVPTGSTPVAAAYFLSSNLRLIDGSNGDVADTNVDRTGQLITGPTGDWRLPYRLQTGTAKYLANGTPTNAIGVPSGSTPVAMAYFLTSDGRLIDGSNGDVNDTNVSTTGQAAIGADGNWRLPYRKQDGTAKYLANGTPTNAVGVSTGATPVAMAYFLTSDGRLIDGSNGDVNDTNVAVAGQASMGATGNWRLPYRTNDGTAKYLANGTPTTTIGVPTGSTPVAAAYFLTSDGRLIDGSNGDVNATNVTTTGQFTGTESSWRLPFAVRTATC